MTSVTEELRLAADFAPSTFEDWRRLVDGVLKGAPFEKLVSETYDGLKIDPIYPRARGAAAVAGRPAATPWQLMQRIDHPDATQANAQALHDLENGATGLALVFAGANSAHGFGLEPSAAALEKVLEGVVINAGVSIELQVGPQSRMAAKYLGTHHTQRPRSRRLRYPVWSGSARRMRRLGIQPLSMARDRHRGHEWHQSACWYGIQRTVRGCRWSGDP